jgi:hypothetical protein
MHEFHSFFRDPTPNIDDGHNEWIMNEWMVNGQQQQTLESREPKYIRR